MASEGTRPALASYLFIYPSIPLPRPIRPPNHSPIPLSDYSSTIQPSIHSPTHTSNKHLTCAPMCQASECLEMLRCTKQNIRNSQQRKSSGIEVFSKTPTGQCGWMRGDPSSRSSSVPRRPWICPFHSLAAVSSSSIV